LGDFVLPEQRTVQNLIEEAMTKALREKGYSVVERGFAGYENALPVQADIGQLWAYTTPGFWVLTFEFETVVTVKGDVFPTSKEEQVRGYGRKLAQTGVESNWIEAIQIGIDDFIENLKKKLLSAKSE